MNGSDLNGFWVAIIGILLFTLGAIIRHYYRSSDIQIEKRKKHTKLLYESIITKWVEIDFFLNHLEPSLSNIGYFEIKDKKEFIWAQQHIKKKYKNIWIPWSEAITLKDDFPSVIKPTINKIENRIHNKIIHIFPEIEQKTYRTRTTKSYYSERIIGEIWVILKSHIDYPKNPISFDVEFRTNENTIYWNNRQVISYPNISQFDRMEVHNFFYDLLHNEIIYNEIKELKNIEDEIKGYISDFKDGLTELILHLNQDEILKGKCRGCSWFMKKFDKG